MWSCATLLLTQKITPPLQTTDPSVKPGDRAQLYVLKKPPRMIEPPPPRLDDKDHWTPLVLLEADKEAAAQARQLKEEWRMPRYVDALSKTLLKLRIDRCEVLLFPMVFGEMISR